MKTRLSLLTLTFIALSLTSTRALEDEVAAAERAAKKPAVAPMPTRGTQMEYGPMLCSTLALPGKAPDRLLALKGVIVRLGKDAAVCFDADTLRLAAGWTGDFLDFNEANLGSYKGTGLGAPMIAGTLAFRTEDAPGWSLTDDFADARTGKAGPLPRGVAQYRGFHRNGERVVFDYRFADCDILESPTMLEVAGTRVFARQFTLGKSAQPLHLLLAAAPAQTRVVGADLKRVAIGDRSSLTIPARAEPLHFTVLISAQALDGLPADPVSPRPHSTDETRRANVAGDHARGHAGGGLGGLCRGYDSVAGGKSVEIVDATERIGFFCGWPRRSLDAEWRRVARLRAR